MDFNSLVPQAREEGRLSQNIVYIQGQQTILLSTDYAQNKDLLADAQTLLEENLFVNKSVESTRRLPLGHSHQTEDK